METHAVGTKDEQELFHEVHSHYLLAKEDLEVRLTGFDKMDVLFRSHIDESKWPYRSLVFDPRVFTTLYEKTARTFANKPRGRMVPRDGGDVLKASINNEILNFQWDENERVDGTPMLSKWAMMDLNARKYGASFALTRWRYETRVRRSEDKKGKVTGSSKVFYDGPDFEVLNNRDCLPNPSYSTVKNWFDVRSYPTFQELRSTNDAARSKPIYKNLDLLRSRMSEESGKGGDSRESNYVNKNKAIKGLTDYLGRDEVYKTLEIVTEYRPDRWITFAPRYGVILRDIPNPYDHGQIPIVMLKYYPVDDDIYGLSEIEPVEKIQKAINAVVCQYLDAINMSLYSPLKVNSTGGAVQMHTLEFGPGKKWLMSNPQTDVVAHDQQITGVSEFSSTYRFLVGAMQEALGETSAATSNLNPGAEGKTATEVKDLAISRSARDNFNQLFLSEAMKKQAIFWHTMNQQFFFSDADKKNKIIQIVGKDAIKFFKKMGLDGMGLSDDAQDMLADPNVASTSIQPSDLEGPLYGVEMGGMTVPKFELDETGQVGKLIVEPDDLSGLYDFIPDVGSMNANAGQEEIKAKSQAIELLTANPNVAAALMREGKQVKVSDLVTDYLEDIGFKDADQYIETMQMQEGLNGQPGQTQPPGAGGAQASAQGPVSVGLGGIPGGPAPIPGGQIA
jgi:hypothetical protein